MRKPLHLQRGDPLPDLPVVGGFELSTYTGSWLLLVFDCAWSATGIDALESASARFGKRIAVAVIDARAEPVSSRRVGALVGEDSWFDLALLIDPRGRVQCSATGENALGAAIVALANEAP